MMQSVLTAIPNHSMSCFQLPVSLCKRFQSVLTRFWWDDNDEKKKMCWVSRTELTKPKEQGGLGFRDIQLFNQALLAKIAWRLLISQNSLLSKTLLGKYCHSKSFLDAYPPASCSHGWRGILHGRDLLKKNLGKALGNGRSTKIWKDSWLSPSSDLRPFCPISVDAQDLWVSDLLTTDLKWNTKRIAELLSNVAQEIQSIHPS